MTASEILMVVFTAVIAVTGVIGAIIFGGQLSVMQGQLNEMRSAGTYTKAAADAANHSAKIAEASLIAGQRAFISVVFQPTAVRNVNTEEIVAWTFTPVWQNAGNTPTRQMENHVNIKIFPGQLPKDWDFPDLWPKGTTEGDMVPVPLPGPARGTVNGHMVGASVDELKEIVAKTKFLYMWGWATYNDVFPDTPKHVTRFAVQIVVDGDPTDKDKTSFSFQFLRRYNCSDEECDRQGFPPSWEPRNEIAQ